MSGCDPHRVVSFPTQVSLPLTENKQQYETLPTCSCIHISLVHVRLAPVCVDFLTAAKSD